MKQRAIVKAEQEEHPRQVVVNQPYSLVDCEHKKAVVVDKKGKKQAFDVVYRASASVTFRKIHPSQKNHLDMTRQELKEYLLKIAEQGGKRKTPQELFDERERLKEEREKKTCSKGAKKGIHKACDDSEKIPSSLGLIPPPGRGPGVYLVDNPKQDCEGGQEEGIGVKEKDEGGCEGDYNEGHEGEDCDDEARDEIKKRFKEKVKEKDKDMGEKKSSDAPTTLRMLPAALVLLAISVSL